MRQLLFILPGIFLFSACGEAVHTEKYYKEHPKERAEKIRECKTLTDITAAQKEECKNTFSANRKRGEILDSTKYNYKY